MKIVSTFLQVFNMIDPKLNSPEEIRPFLEAHIQIDLQQISQCCGKNIDDCILLLHDVIERLQQSLFYFNHAASK